MTAPAVEETAPDYRPARGYTWKTFEPNNMAHLKHGAFSERIISEHAAQIRALLLDRYEYLGDLVFLEALERYCRAEARAQLLHAFVMETAATEGVNAVRAYLWSEATRADALAAKTGSDLGLDPRGHSAISRDLGLAAGLRLERSALQVKTLQDEGRRLAALKEGNGHG